MAAVTHHIPPNPGVTEMRVHGVGGTPPESMLEQTGVTQVTGDATAGFYRGAIAVPGRTVEAYSWGGLTTRSRSRAFWILLLPFSLVNLAGWMVEPPKLQGGAVETSSRTLGTRIHESFVALLGVVTTAMYVMWAALLAMNALAFQCGAIRECRDDRWYLDFLGAGFFHEAPGRRVVVSLVVPLALLALFFGLGFLSRSRYDDYGSINRAVDDPASGSLLGAREFWYTAGWQRQMSYLHLAVVLAILAGLLGRASREFEVRFAVDVVPNVGYTVFWTSLAVALAAAAVLFVAALSAKDLMVGSRVIEWAGLGLLGLSVALLLFSGWLTSNLRIADSSLVKAAPDEGGVLRPVTDLWGFGWTPIVLLGVAVALVGAFSVVQLWRWLAWSQVYLDQIAVVVMLAYIAFWDAAPVVAAVAAGAAVVVEVTQWASRRSRATDENAQPWRLGVYALTVALGIGTWVVTRGAAPPYGDDWPRLTPLIVFAVTLAVLAAVRLIINGAPAAAATAVAVPAGIVAAGYLAGALTTRQEWRYTSVGLALIILSVVWLAQQNFDRWRWNGPGATAILGLSIIMGVFSGGALRLADFLDRDGSVFLFRATAIYEWLVVGFVAMLGAGLVGLVVWVLLVRMRAPVTGDGATRVTNRYEALAEGIRAADVAVTMIALAILAGALALVWHLARGELSVMEWIDFGVPDGWSAIVDLATWITLFIVVTVFAVVRSGLRDPAARRRLGTLWDVASFWPRNFHPFAPPAYASRAIPELQARLIETAGPGSAPAPGRVILSAHSQGTVVAVATIAGLPPEVRRRIRLVTHGSPLRRFYGRYFPRYFPDTLLLRTATTVGPSDEIGDGGWLNYWRATDPIGDPVFPPKMDRPGMPPPEVAAALETSMTGSANRPDVRLFDPIESGVSEFQMVNRVRGHPGYMADRALSGAIDAWAAVLGRG